MGLFVDCRVYIIVGFELLLICEVLLIVKYCRVLINYCYYISNCVLYSSRLVHVIGTREIHKCDAVLEDVCIKFKLDIVNDRLSLSEIVYIDEGVERLHGS